MFAYNVEAHPEYVNGFDSLGEAHFVAGDLDRALTLYEHVLAQDPSSRNASGMIRRIREAQAGRSTRGAE